MNMPAQPSPVVRTGSLPANNNPPVQQRTVTNPGAPTTGGGPTQPQTASNQAQTAPAPAKPRKKRKSSGSQMIVAGVELTAEELQAFGRIALKAGQQRLTPAEYIELQKRDVGAEIAVYDKVYGTAAEPQDDGEDEGPAS